jgi:hypothetical protein
MGVGSLVCALAGIAAVAIANVGKYLALGLGIFAFGLGLTAYRRQDQRPRPRLLGATGTALGAIAAILGGVKIALTWLMLQKLAEIFGGS